jgi:hypothetical protein
MRRPQKLFASLSPLLLAVTAVACGPETPNPVTPESAALPPAATNPAAAAPAPPAAAKPAFENPGGMWMPEQLAQQAPTLKSLGLEIDPAALSQPTSELLGSVVSLGGCSASFISSDGLIATNHHCATGALQYNSTPQENLLQNGYLAKTRADERWNGPTARVLVTQSLRDVTKEMRDGIDAIKDDAARQKKVEEHQKALVAACEKGRPGLRCNVASYFGGAQYRLIEQLEIKDVRLVFAPHEGVGNFGGEIDNWRWPRHDADVSLFRAYVGKDGKPADHSADNVPYHPPHHFKIATKPLQAGDLVFVAGYPGQTNRLRTAGEVEEAVSWFYPRAIKFIEENVAVLEQLSKTSPELAIKANPRIRGLNNALTKFRGIMDGLVKGGLAAQKTKTEGDLKAWVAADATRKAAYGDVLDRLAGLENDRRKTRDQDAALDQVYQMVNLVRSAGTIVRMAEERPKPDAERDPGFQERNWQRHEQMETAQQKRYDQAMDRALFKLALQRAARAPEKDRAPFVAMVLGKGEVTDARIDKALEALYKDTKLEELDTRVKLFKTAKLADLKKSKDPLMQLALKLRPLQKAMDDRDDAFTGALAVIRPRYIAMLQNWSPGPLAPDANGTLRVTYGTVRGYKPTADAPIYRPFTTLSEMVKKHTGKEPFNAPAPVLAAFNAKKFGSYVSADLGEVPVDFLSDLDITGGNSGSATLNSRGELVGLAFDGNYESMASDWLFMPSITRTIHVDLRYVLWLLDAVYGGDHLVKEMGGASSVN